MLTISAEGGYAKSICFLHKYEIRESFFKGILSFIFEIFLPVNIRLKNATLKHFQYCNGSSRPEVFSAKKLFLEILQNSQEITCARVSFLIHRCFPGNFAKFLRTPFFIGQLWLLLLLKTTVLTFKNCNKEN